MEDQKQWPGLARNLDFAEGAGLEVNVEKLKCLNLEKMSHLVLLKRITDGAWG